MASADAAVPEQFSAFFERLLRHRDVSLFLPFFLGYSIAAEASTTDDTPVEESQQQQERIILINPFTQGMIVIEGGASSFDSILRDLDGNGGHPPASKAAIEGLPVAEIREGDDIDGECAICLDDWEIGAEVKLLPCSHKFHPNCIEKWLGMRGSCPVCRYRMPVDDDCARKEGNEADRTRLGREIWVSFSLNGSRSTGDRNAGSHPSDD